MTGNNVNNPRYFDGHIHFVKRWIEHNELL